jgi:hypothetical protein
MKRNSAYVCSDCSVSPGIISGIQGIPTDIAHMKRMRLQDGEQQIYLLKAWVKDIEPPITCKYFQFSTSVM